MSLVQIAFYAFGSLAIIAALLILATRQVLYAAFLLMLCFLCLAALYVLAGADFVGVTQLVVYVGGILVLMVFGVMLTNRQRNANAQQSKPVVLTGVQNRFWALLIASGLGLALVVGLLLVNSQVLANTAQPSGSTVSGLGVGLMTNYLLPFELAAVLLLLAVIGAAYVAGKPRT